MMRGAQPAPLVPPGTEALAPFVDAGILRTTEIQVAAALMRSVPGTADEVLLAAALCVRALQLGHVCVEPATVAEVVVADTAGPEETPEETPDISVLRGALPWPDAATWNERLCSSDAVAVCDPVTAGPSAALHRGTIRPLVFDGTRVYLERYWRYERSIGDALLAGPAAEPTDEDEEVEAALDRYLGPSTLAGGNAGHRGGEAPGRVNLQRLAAATALRATGATDLRQSAATTARGNVTVIAGGPGTGKTYTIARMLAAMHHLGLASGAPPEVALAAPTGKAAARMTEAVHAAVTAAGTDPEVGLPREVSDQLLGTEASTIHRLLGHRDGISFRHDHDNPLPHDVVVVDETSMVALPLMARLLDALRPETLLVLVGDPFQLASVEAGAVLGDVVGPAARSDSPVEGPLSDGIVVLRRVHRFEEDSDIAVLADAIRDDDAQRAMDVLADPEHPGVRWVDPADTDALLELRGTVSANAASVVRAARDGRAELALESAKALKVLCGIRVGPLGSFAWSDDQESRLAELVPGFSARDPWYPGRPVMVTSNDYITGVFNGDTGVVVGDGDRRVVMEAGGGIRTLSVSQLDDVDTWWAMTIHKSQGSEFDHVVVSLPDTGSRILSNELLYTGITRAKERVTVVASEDAIRAAVTRRIARASGLGARLWPR